MSDDPLQTISPDQVPVISAIPENAFVFVQTEGGPLQRIAHGSLLAKLIAAGLVKVDEAELQADLAHDANVVALVENDATPLNNGWYRKVGASGAGNWVQFEQTAKAVRESIVGSAGDASKAVALANGFSQWSDLASFADQMGDGDRTIVAASDTGTHTDPVAGAGTKNGGRYAKQAGYALPVRIGDLDSQRASDVVETVEQFTEPGAAALIDYDGRSVSEALDDQEAITAIIEQFGDERSAPNAPLLAGKTIAFPEFGNDAVRALDVLIRAILSDGSTWLYNLLAESAHVGGDLQVGGNLLIPGARLDADEYNYDFFVATEDGDVLCGLLDGVWYPNAGTAATIDIACIGDSLTESGNASMPGGYYPARVALDTGRVAYNVGVIGQTAAQIASRQGGTCALFTVTGNSIPASGPVAVTARTTDPLTINGAQTMLGTLAGIHGTLARNASDSSYTFTRAAAGLARNCPAQTPFIPDLALARQADTQILWAGRNDVSNTTGALASATVIALVDSMVRFLPHQRFLVFGITTKSDGTENPGSAAYQNIVSHNNTLAAKYGKRFFDIRRWLIDDALAAMGLTATSQDTADIANDLIPSQLMDAGDKLHFRAATYTAIGIKAAALLTELEI